MAHVAVSEPLDTDDVQGVLARGFGHLKQAAFLLVTVDDPSQARPALRRLGRSVTSAASPTSSSAVNVALTAEGVRALTQAPLHAGFGEPFAQGMTSPYRSRVLGDHGEDAPEHWAWGGPNTEPVHLLLMLYGLDAATLGGLVEQVTGEVLAGGMRVLVRLDTDPLSDREPFGFRDGLSQPAVAGFEEHAAQGAVASGEFVLGYRNEYGQRTFRPLLTLDADPDRLLPRAHDAGGAPDLGRNGTYLVLRQLEQDVEGFWTWVDRASAGSDGTPDPARREQLAAKLVGRWPSGAPVTLSPDTDDPSLADANDFGYASDDRLGLRCPVGAHVRRVNPRDSLEPQPGTPRSLEVNRRHRLLRRGRSYTGADGERGLAFLCLGANLARQYEFVQHSWVNDPAFAGLCDSTDPLVGPRHGGGGGDFVEPAVHLRRRHRGLPQFVHVRGGAYFFLPGRRALAHLLQDPADPGARTDGRTRSMLQRTETTGTNHGEYHGALHWRAFRGLARALDHRRGWDRLPVPLGLAVLVGLRDALRRDNLHDTASLPTLPLPRLPRPSPTVRTGRTVDGSYNDLEHPRAGMAGARFGRNIRLDALPTSTAADVLEPSPRRLSLELMTRRELIPAESVNALVAAWLQWMIRDWFSHGAGPAQDPWRIELDDDDPWPERPMRIPRTPDDPTRLPGTPGPRTSVNTCSHWWDASQIYGTTPEYQKAVRTDADGMLRVLADGTLPVPEGEGGPTKEPGFWLGLVLLQTAFTREHNAVCAALHEAYPDYGDEELFQRARLVVAALIAKIHTTEWTPAVISHPTTVTGMRANWWGLAGERVTRAFGRISGSEVISGIPGAETDSYGVPYSLTEEFTAVYRMHPLMPDEFSLRSHVDDAELRAEATTLREMSGAGALELLEDIPMVDLLYSFGTLHPGLVTLHNFPRFLQEFVRPDGQLMDLAAADILRHREMSVPRYCAFRKELGMTVPSRFEDLTEDPATAARLRELYDGDLDRVDLMVGLYAERRPAGFAFSDTAFRIFIVMASRRLNSDRFLTVDFTPAVYTPVGLRWVAETTMEDVLLRHYPELRPALRGLDNAFLPWKRAGTS
ncbi:MAG: heme peroxidase [Frankiales bacterium]|nr:heme peroxidase [Frankiales bacterium]